MEENIQQMVDRLVNQPMQFAFENGVTVTRAEPDYTEGILQTGPTSRNPQGTIHGGAIFTLADTVAGCCACSRGVLGVTAHHSMEFLRSATEGPVRCTAIPKKMGRSLSVIAVTITGPLDELLATGTFTFFMFSKK